MKILQINKCHFVRGGADSVYFNISRLLESKGQEVIHFAMQYAENEASSTSQFFAANNDFTQHSLMQNIINSPSFFYNRDAAEKLNKLILAEKPDIAHLHLFYGSLTSSVLKVLKDHKIPVVISVHDYKFVCPAYLFLNGKNEICEKCKGKNYYHAVLNNCVKKNKVYSAFFAMECYYRDAFYPIHKMFKKIIFVGDFSQKIHFKYKPELQTSSTYLYNFDPAIHSKKANSDKGSYFLYLGRLSREKGVHLLAHAFSELPGIHLKVAGTGEEMNALQEINAPNIELLGFVKGESLTSLIKNASFVVVPSECYENNPMAIVESYTLGKPVIAARIGGIPEIVVTGKTGFLFESSNIEDLKQTVIKANTVTPEEYRTMSTEAEKFAHDNFHPDLYYEKRMKIYHEAIGT